MESKYNITEIITQVGDIGELVSRMKTEGPVHAIEIDIVLEKIRNLYTDVSNLKELNIPAAKQGAEPAKVKAEEPAKGQAEGPAMQAGVQEEKTLVPPEIKASEEPATIADKFKGEKKFINERLGDNGNRQDVSSKLQSKPIRDIGTSLGLNDRFKLINELFNGDKESYQQTINILDNATNFNEAFNYISTSYDWDMEDEAVQMLLDLVRRKFIVNKNE
ncbi:MAG: hypothetical protein AMS23_10155 [Bacteroides sp. SM1_62]|nr:MAG: hypothetical protein AMS26_03260 [Bacteroides sp. SM23_62]KPL20920.1 MAG: hypothetical protein AMS23_10155 [Bacteroides sp. SM1_62]